ncbi:hypothetical protein Tco_1254729 [Tanacetum coccineum]
MVKHEPHFILEIFDNGFGSLAMRACVFLRSRRVFNLKGLIRREKEHQSDTLVIIVKMEILLEATSNKLMVDPHGFEGYLKMKVKVPDSSCLKDS